MLIHRVSNYEFIRLGKINNSVKYFSKKSKSWALDVSTIFVQ
jgi:hypothetical protein